MNTLKALPPVDQKSQLCICRNVNVDDFMATKVNPLPHLHKCDNFMPFTVTSSLIQVGISATGL